MSQPTSSFVADSSGDAPMLGSAPDIAAWLVQSGIDGASQEELLDGYCERLLETGVKLQRVHVVHRAHHPQWGSIGFDWRRAKGSAGREAYIRVEGPRVQWRQSPLYHLLQTPGPEFRARLVPGEMLERFPLLAALAERGGTDYFAAKTFFGGVSNSAAVDGDKPPEGFLISWTCDHPDGFAESSLDMLRTTLPCLAIALKSAANRQMADDIVATYLGADAGRRVLSGELRRGSVEQIDTVVWSFDLRGFTHLSETLPGPDMIRLLNAVFEEVVDVVDARGGNVLKFIGDGLLAIFSDDDAADRAVAAAREAEARLDALISARRAEGLPVAGFVLALNRGEVLYGNIGGAARLDFTVIGPAVNTAARLLGLCGVLDRRLLISSQVAEAAHTHRAEMRPLGAHKLRGVSAPVEVFTFDT